MSVQQNSTEASVDPLALAEQSLHELPSLAPPARERRRAEIIQLCVPWARREAVRYRHSGEPLEDLVQVAMVGLILAVDRYDVGRRVPFRHFAQPTVTGEIKRYFRDRGWSMRVSRRVQELYQEVRQAEPALTQRLGRVPSNHDLAEHLHLPEDDIDEARRGELVYRTKSLNRPASDDSDGELGDLFGGPDPMIEMVADMDALRRAVHILPERLRMILSLRFLDDLTQCQIADKLGISQMHVSRLISRALGLLRDHMTAESPTSLDRRRPALSGFGPTGAG
jgi:RNA polymerase sigma-B factor